MSKLPDLEGLAIFAKVVELRSFAAAADELALSKATVSKAVTRLETRLGARLFNRTSRRLALTDAGQSLVEPATRVLAQGEEGREGRGRGAAAAAPGCGPDWPRRCRSAGRTSRRRCREFLTLYPEVTVDLHLSDATIDLVGMGFDRRPAHCGPADPGQPGGATAAAGACRSKCRLAPTARPGHGRCASDPSRPA